MKIPVLAMLGDQFDLAAANVVLEQRNPRRVSWPSVLAPALVVLVVVVALSVKLTPTAEALVVRAADHTAASTTGRFKMSTHVDRPDASATSAAPADAVDVSAEGTYDQSTRRLRTRVDLSHVFGSAGPSPSVSAANGIVDTIEDGPTIYLKAPIFEQVLAQHTPWVKVDTSKLARSTSLSPAVSSAVSSAANLSGAVTDPSSFLQALRGMGGDTHVVGRAQIDGVSSLHYRGTVDLDQAASRLPADERSQLRDGFKRLGVDQSTVQIPMDVWVDDNGVVRRVSTNVKVGDDPANDSALRGAVITVTVDYYDLGLPEPIVTPEPSKVTDVTAMVEASLAGPLGGH